MATSDSPRPQDKLVILKRIPVFASCSEEQIQLIAERTRLVEYKKGEYIYRENDPAEAFYIVGFGRLRVFSQSEGLDKTFAILHSGDSFGEISLLTGEKHSATVQALNDTLVLQLEKEDFDDVINRIPSLVLYLSRLLSKRLRTKEHGGEFADTTIAAIYSATRGVGRTCFAMALAFALKQETAQETVIVDLCQSGGSQEWPYGSAGALETTHYVQRPSDEEHPFGAALLTHPLGFSVLQAGELQAQERGEQLIAPLLSSLTSRFKYILIDLPVEVDAFVLKALTQADLIYLMTNPMREHVLRTSALIHQVQAAVSGLTQRMKIVLNLIEASVDSISSSDVAQQLGQSVAFTLPHAPSLSEQPTADELVHFLENRTSPYGVTVRRAARELGGLLVGLALGSGAALGLAHIGILKVIERERIPIDVIAGSSIGALVAGLWASGRSAKELEEIALKLKNPWDVRRLFVLDLGIPAVGMIVGLLSGGFVGWLAGFWTGLLIGFMVTVAFGVVLGPLVGGPIQGAKLMAKLQQDFAGKTFEDTWLPLKIIAANPVAREEVVFESGPIADAVRVSVSIPGIFKPVTYRGRWCLDGGVVNPIPVSVLKRSGVNRVIAVNVFPTTPELGAYQHELQRRRAERDAQLASRRLPIRVLMRIRQELVRSISPLVFDVIMRSMQFMEYQIAEVSCREADLILRPTVPGSHWLEFFNPEKFIQRGEEVALQHLPELQRLTRVREHG
jgi:NTE family protein